MKTAVFFQIIFNGMIDQGIVEDDPMEEVLREAKEKKERKRNPLGYMNQALDCQSISSTGSSLSFRPQNTKL